MPACLVEFHALFTATIEVNASYSPHFAAFNLYYCYPFGKYLKIFKYLKKLQKIRHDLESMSESQSKKGKWAA